MDRELGISQLKEAKVRLDAARKIWKAEQKQHKEDLRISAAVILNSAKEELSEEEWLPLLREYDLIKVATRLLNRKPTQIKPKKSKLDDTVAEAVEIEADLGHLEKRNQRRGKEFRRVFMNQLLNLNREEFIQTFKAVIAMACQLGISKEESGIRLTPALSPLQPSAGAHQLTNGSTSTTGVAQAPSPQTQGDHHEYDI